MKAAAPVELFPPIVDILSLLRISVQRIYAWLLMGRCAQDPSGLQSSRMRPACEVFQTDSNPLRPSNGHA